MLGAAAVTGVVAAASVPLDRPGVGWMVTGLAGTAALLTVSRRLRPLWTAATVALLGVGTFRAAGWLFALCLLTALVTASLAVVRGRSVPALLAAAHAVPVAALRALPWTAGGVAALARARQGSSSVRTGAAVGVSALLLVVFGGLFASADAAFAELAGRVLPDLAVPTIFRWVFVFGGTAAGLLGAAYLLAAPPDLAGLERPAKARVHRLEWTLPLTVLNAVFAVFVAVQLTVLFGGAKHVLSTAGLTFAEYARRGFWQLLVVTALTLGVLALGARWAPQERRADRILVRALLGTLAGLCLVIVASALYRMHTYEEAYGFTRLRVLVSVCELWLGAILVMVLVAVVRLRASWLPQAVVGSAVAALIGLAALNPDHFIADRNVTRYEQTEKIDVAYLSGLSADAAPALDRLPAPLRGCALGNVSDDLAEDHDWRQWNLARSRARAVLEDLPAESYPWPEACGPARYYW
ncbi:hypothetical protein Prum_043310 [Phytohabitans rumicis]|uniref:Uncharacterized protein n=1 Tax=Phytohabitans rumicis TaxID=1076125 RepID=A0A6V8L7R9_9ACTN|nr:hypothetical protein Prum_043310 [Phytohabitans rumicis]